MRIIIAGLILALFTSACGSKKASDDDFVAGLDTAQSVGPTIDAQVIGQILEGIPAPLEISVLLKESGKKYNGSYLNSPDNLSRYNSNYKRALNLGIYGTDLGYTNIYEQNQDGLKYMASIKELADGLNIGQFFEVEKIGRLAANSKNLDSLLLITTQNFNSINGFLQSQDRSNLSVLLLTGGWLEALHILCEVAKLSPDNKDLQETIGEQKIILDNIKLLLSFYSESDPNMASLLADVEELKKTYDRVSIIYTYKDPTSQVIDGVLVIKDNSTSTIQITRKDVEDISTITKNIRTKIVS
jgi:hypothetical protein